MLDPVGREVARHDTNRCCKNVPRRWCVEVSGNKYTPERRETHLPQHWVAKGFGLNFWCGNGAEHCTRQRQLHDAVQCESVSKAPEHNKGSSKCR